MFEEMELLEEESVAEIIRGVLVILSKNEGLLFGKSRKSNAGY